MKDLDVRKLEDLFRESAEMAVEKLPWQWVNYCQSQIEKLMLLALWSRGVWTESIKFAQAPVLKMMIEDANHPDNLSSILAPQVQVGPYRVDFLIAMRRRLHHRDVILFAVECDGHDFHERTKAQAAKDKARDRYLAAEGITVLRYTGSEIWRDAGACADDVLGILATKTIDDASMWHQIREKADYIPERHQ